MPIWKVKVEFPKLQKAELKVEGKKLSDFKWLAIEFSSFRNKFKVNVFRMRIGDRMEYRVAEKPPNDSWTVCVQPPSGIDWLYTKTTTKEGATTLIGRAIVFGREQKPFVKKME